MYTYYRYNGVFMLITNFCGCYSVYVNYVHGKKFGNIKHPNTVYPRK